MHVSTSSLLDRLQLASATGTELTLSQEDVAAVRRAFDLLKVALRETESLERICRETGRHEWAVKFRADVAGVLGKP